MNQRALIALGSNLGDRRAILDAAAEQLRARPGVNLLAVSSYHETRPVGGPLGQGPFLNAAAVLEPTLDPGALLGVLQDLEAQFGRVRRVRWGQRTLDLDLILYGDQIHTAPELTLPHPRFAFRRFVLAPAAEVAPELTDPLTARTIAELLAHLDRRPSYLALEGWWRHAPLRPAVERLVADLDTFCWSYRDLLSLAPRLPQPWRDRALPSLLERLEPDRWLTLGEQWLVTDFSPGELVRQGIETWPHLVELPLLTPTLIVECPETVGEEAKCHFQPQCGSSPRVRLQSCTPDEQVSEILAACAATRV